MTKEKNLGGSPVNPPFSIRVNVEQNQTLHLIREDQLQTEQRKHFFLKYGLLYGSFFNRKSATE